MKLVGKLKDKVNKAETKEQAKELIANAGMELTDDEMDKVSGGGSMTKFNQIQDMLLKRPPNVDEKFAELEQQMKQQTESIENKYRMESEI